MARAVLCYQKEQAKPGPGKKAGLRTICWDLEKAYYLEKGKRISLNHNTLRNLANGRQMRSEANAAKGWLTKEEANEVVEYVIEVANWGHCSSHQ
jgi:hypothetical protein